MLMTEEINQKLKHSRDKCAHLTFIATMQAFVWEGEITRSQAHYLIRWQTQPGEGVFESTALVNQSVSNGKRTVFNLIPQQGGLEITRINMHGDQSFCMAGSPPLDLYCYCNSLLT